MKGLACLVAWLVLVSAAGHAAVVEGLHSAVVPVADRSDDAFASSLREALAAVLVKLSGDSRVPATAGARALLGNPRQYMTGFGYETSRNGGLALRANFDPAALEAALLARGLPLWGKERPALRLRIALEPLPAGAPPEPGAWLAAADRHAAARGIPLLRPAAADALTVGEADLNAVLAGLAEPGAGAVLLVGEVVQRDPATWDSRWLLAIGDERREHRASGETAESLVEAGVDFAADALGARYAATGGAEARLDLIVRDIRSAEDFGRASSYLRGFDAVRELGVKRVEGSTVVFDVTARGGLALLAQGIELGTLLAPAPDQPGTYRLLPR